MTYSITSPANYLASVGMSEATLKSICMKKAVVTNVNSTGTVTVELNSISYENIPVWMHTDKGARSRLIAGQPIDLEAVPPDEPEDYFEDSALMFTVESGTYIRDIKTAMDESSLARSSDGVEVLVMTSLVEDVATPIAVIGILSNGVSPVSFDRTSKYHPTFVPVIIVKEEHGASSGAYYFSLFDMTTNDWMQVSNAAGDAIITAVGLEANGTYDYITDDGFEIFPDSYTLTDSCHIYMSQVINDAPGSPSVGDTISTGSCTCGTTIPFGDPLYECIQADYVSCPGGTRLKEQTWIPLCATDAGYAYQEANTASCDTGSGIYWEVDDYAGVTTNFGFPISGKSTYELDTYSYEFTRSITAQGSDNNNVLDVTVESGGDTLEFNYDFSTDPFPITMTSEQIIFDSHGSFFFSFSCIFLMFSTGDSVGGLQQDSTPADGLSFSNFTAKLKERYSSIVSASGDATLEVVSGFIPYDVMLRNTLATI